MADDQSDGERIVSNRLETRPGAKASVAMPSLPRVVFPVTAGVHGHAQGVVVVTGRIRPEPLASTEPTAKE